MTMSVDEALREGPRRGRDAVDALIDQLSPWELLYLRSRARGITVDATASNGFATCTELPSEIICLIVRNLDYEDLLGLRLVSKSWKNLWMQPAVLSTAIRALFPGLLCFYPEEHDLEKLYLSALSLYRSKTPGGGTSTIVPWDIDDTLRDLPADGVSALDLSKAFIGRYMTVNGPDPIYNDGKMVWQPYSGQVVVDDLRTGLRTRHTAGDDPRKRNRSDSLVAVTGKVFVLMSTSTSMSGPTDKFRLLHIYHLEHREWRHISLPGGLSKCYASCETIVATCQGGQTIIWSWDKPMEELPTCPQPPTKLFHCSNRLFGGIPGVIIHPQSSHIVFLVYVYRQRPDIVDENASPSHEHSQTPILEEPIGSAGGQPPLYTVVIVRCERNQEEGWIAAKQFERHVPFPDMDPVDYRRVINRERTPLVSFTLICDKTDNNGSFSLGICRANIRPDAHDRLPESARSWWAWSNGMIHCFNVISESFIELSFREYREKMHTTRVFSMLPNETGSWCDETRRTIRLWNMQLFQAHGVERTTILRTTNNVNPDETQYNEYPVVESVMANPVGMYWDSALDGPNRPFWFDKNQVSRRGPFRLFVDDDFMVVTSRHGYVVRCFRDAGTNGWLSKSPQPTHFRPESSERSKLSPPPPRRLCLCLSMFGVHGSNTEAAPESISAV